MTKTAKRLLALKDIAWKPYKEISTDSLFGNYNHKDFFFIQVGANDGITGDDLRKYILKYQWHGILVEPVPYVFDRLIKNYKEVEHLELLAPSR